MTLGRHQLRLEPSSRRALAVLALVGAFYFVARGSGAGWVVVLMCALAATVVVGAIWPLITLMRARVEVIDSPSDATAGSSVTVTLRVRTAGSGVRVRWRDAQVTSVRRRRSSRAVPGTTPCGESAPIQPGIPSASSTGPPPRGGERSW